MIYGIGPSVTRTGFMAAVEIIAYDTTKELVANHTSFDAENTMFYPFYGFMAGFMGALFANPVDVIKTRMMNNGAMYGTTLNCVKDLVKNDGPLGFAKGIKPALARACSFNITFFFSVGFWRNFLTTKDTE